MWKTVHTVVAEAEARRLQRQKNLLDRLGLPDLGDCLDDDISSWLDRARQSPKTLQKKGEEQR